MVPKIAFFCKIFISIWANVCWSLSQYDTSIEIGFLKFILARYFDVFDDFYRCLELTTASEREKQVKARDKVSVKFSDLCKNHADF